MTCKWFIFLCISLFAVTAMARVQGDGPAGLVVMEAELYDAIVPADVNEFEWEFDTEFDGFSRDGYMRAMPPETRIDSDITRSPRLDYDVEITQPGTQYLWARAYAPNNSQNSYHLGVNGELTVDRVNVDPAGEWLWLNVANNGQPGAIEVNEPGMVTINCWLRESGICIDKILLTSDPNYMPVGLGPRDQMLDSMLSLDPNDNLVATGDKGMILSIDGIDVNDLVLGTTTFAGEPKHGDQLPEYADNFDLNSDASADDQAYVQTMFDLPITTLYLVERGGGDPGMMVPLDRMGLPMDDPTPFTANDNFGALPYKSYSNQGSKLMKVTPEAPIFGIQILPPEGGNLGIDPASISGIPGSLVAVKPIDSLDYLSEADLDPNNGDPNTLVEVLGINGTEAEGLVLGMTTADFQKHDAYLITDGDNFDLTTKASHDDATFIETLFPIPVTQIFIMEVGANDSGLFQPLDVDGLPIGSPVAFVAKDSQFQDEGLKIMTQTAGGFAITSGVPLGGLQILQQSGIDPACICGLPIAMITKAPLDTLVADANAVVESINGYATADLVQGFTIANSDPNRADNADNWDLSETDASRADNRWVTTMFDVPVTQFFVIEKPGGNGNPDDDGWVLPLDIDGNRIGGPLWYSPEDWSSFDIPNAKDGRPPAGQAFTPTTDVPVYGLLHWSDGVDVLCVAAVPAPAPAQE